MRAAARPKWWVFVCETTTDNGLARTRRAHLGGRAEIHFPLSPELLITMCDQTGSRTSRLASRRTALHTTLPQTLTLAGGAPRARVFMTQ